MPSWDEKKTGVHLQPRIDRNKSFCLKRVRKKKLGASGPGLRWLYTVTWVKL
jgi:hypothetical protein